MKKLFLQDIDTEQQYLSFGDVNGDMANMAKHACHIGMKEDIKKKVTSQEARALQFIANDYFDCPNDTDMNLELISLEVE